MPPAELLLRLAFLVAGLSCNAFMLKFLVDANAQSESSTEVTATSLGLNFLFSFLVSLLVDHRCDPRAIKVALVGEYADGAEVAAKYTWRFYSGVLLIVLGVGLINSKFDTHRGGRGVKTK